MHLPEGVFVESTPVLVGTWAIAIAGIGGGSRRFSRGLPEESASLVGVLGAFVFAAQMVNFPLPGPGGVSAHLTGTALLTILLGPSLAMVTMAAVLLVQALLMNDGGLIVYGANVTNLAVLPALASAAMLRAIPARLRYSWGAIVGVAAVSIAVASLACGLELVLGAGLDAEVVLLGLLTTQGIVCIAEGLITAFAFRAIASILGSRTPRWPLVAHDRGGSLDEGRLS